MLSIKHIGEERKLVMIMDWEDEENLALIIMNKQIGIQMNITCSNLGISKKKYYQLLDEHYCIEIDRFKKKGYSIVDMCQHIGIKESKYNKLIKGTQKKKKKNLEDVISRGDRKYLRIDNYENFELYRGIIVEAITRMNDTEEPFQDKIISVHKIFQEDPCKIIDFQNIKKTIFYDKEKIKKEIAKISNDSQDSSSKDLKKRLKDNYWAIRTVMRIFDLEKSLINKIFKKISISDYRALYTNEYNHYNLPEKDFIDILNELMDHQYKYNGHKRKTRDKYFEGRNTELVKHYFLKYIQKPLLKYSIDYSNSLLDEYNFQKVFVEMDLTIPKVEQKELMEKMLEEIYDKELPFNYSEFITQALLKDDKDEILDTISGGKIYKYNSASEKVSDMFYIYDLRMNNISARNCAKKLLDFHCQEKSSMKYNMAESTVKCHYKNTSNFMKKFRKKYTMQTSSLYKTTR